MQKVLSSLNKWSDKITNIAVNPSAAYMSRVPIHAIANISSCLLIDILRYSSVDLLN
jgi:hypothetical protein